MNRSVVLTNIFRTNKMKIKHNYCVNNKCFTLSVTKRSLTQTKTGFSRNKSNKYIGHTVGQAKVGQGRLVHNIPLSSPFSLLLCRNDWAPRWPLPVRSPQPLIQSPHLVWNPPLSAQTLNLQSVQIIDMELIFYHHEVSFSEHFKCLSNAFHKIKNYIYYSVLRTKHYKLLSGWLNGYM